MYLATLGTSHKGFTQHWPLYSWLCMILFSANVLRFIHITAQAIIFFLFLKIFHFLFVYLHVYVACVCLYACICDVCICALIYMEAREGHRAPCAIALRLIPLRGRLSHWTWSWADSQKTPVILLPLSLSSTGAIESCVTYPAFNMGSWALNSSPCACLSRALNLLSHFSCFSLLSLKMSNTPLCVCPSHCV